jgi:hypothetical protein
MRVLYEYLGNHLRTLLIAHLKYSAMSHVRTVLTGDERIATFMLTNSANVVVHQFCLSCSATRDHSRLSSTADSLRPKVRIPGREISSIAGAHDCR